MVKAGEFIPADGEIIEGVASVDESAITGESAPVIRESGGDRSAVTGGTRVLSDWIKIRITADPGPHLPRPDDRAGRRRRAAEDAERDRAQHPAGRPDDHLPARGRHAAAVRDLLGRAAVGVRARVAAGLPDPDDDRRAAVGDRHRRHGPAGAAQRAGDVGPRRRGGRRRPHAAARQDRHDHARQPAGDRVRRAARRDRAGDRRRGAAVVARRRNAGRPVDRRAGEGAVRPPRPRAGRARRGVRPVHGADAHVGRRPRRPRRSGRARPTRSSATWPRNGGVASRRSCRPIVDRIARAGGTPLVVAERTRAARRHPPEGHRQGRHPRALRRSCARWASGP